MQMKTFIKSNVKIVYRLKKIFISLVLVLFVTAGANCHKTTIKVKPQQHPDYIREAKLEKKVRYKSLFLGVKELSTAEPEQCPENRAETVIIKRDLIDSVIHVLIGGVFTTRSVELYCH